MEKTAEKIISPTIGSQRQVNFTCFHSNLFVQIFFYIHIKKEKIPVILTSAAFEILFLIDSPLLTQNQSIYYKFCGADVWPMTKKCIEVTSRCNSI